MTNRESIIYQIKEIIKKDFNPEKIILFGSYAYGNPKENSDIDIFVIKDIERNQIREFKLLILDKLRKIIVNNKIDIDILVNNRTNIDERINMGDLFYKEVIDKGRIIYAK